MIKFYKSVKRKRSVEGEELKNVHIHVGNITIFNARAKGKIYMGNKENGLEGACFSYKMFQKAIEDFYNKNF